MAHHEPSPFRYFNSSPEVIRLGVMMYVKYPLHADVHNHFSAERHRVDRPTFKIVARPPSPSGSS